MLKGKNIVITGAAKGIGREIALKLAQEGANIVLGYRSSEDKAIKLKEEIESYGSRVLIIKGDVTDSNYAKELVTRCKEKFGTIDVLINNAGITKDGLIMRLKDEDFSSVIDTNLKGTFYCSREASILMIKQRSGKIINMSSVIGLIGNAGQVNYSASKAGVIGLTKSLAKELGGRGITVNAIAPGFIETDMTSQLSDNMKEFIKTNLPLRRLGKVDDVANLVVFLASNKSDYITGQVINVDGGMVM